MRALIIEDSLPDRMMYSKMLSSMGIPNVHVPGGEEALELLNTSGDFALLLVDWNMPGMSGVEFVQKVRSEQRGSNITIVMITGRVEMEDINNALAAGVDEYIMKPITLEVMKEKLALVRVRRRGSDE